MTVQIFQVDAFCAEPFKGNPAGVCILDLPQSDEFMQNITAEMNLSETAFITRDFMDVEIRYFTPTTEVPLCGHATLASAHILYEIHYFTKYDQISGGIVRVQNKGERVKIMGRAVTILKGELIHNN